MLANRAQVVDAEGNFGSADKGKIGDFWGPERALRNNTTD
jgi:hypothetical protein